MIKLEQNYRSTATILDAANQVIAHNEGRKDKTLWTDGETGEKIQVCCAGDEREEAAWIIQQLQALQRNGVPFGDTAILYRTNAQSRVPEEMLMKAGIPYRVFGGQKFYERKEIKDILAYMRVIANPADDISLVRIINVPKRAIGDTTVQTLMNDACRKGIPLFGELADLPEELGSRARNSVTEFFRMMTMLCAMKESMTLEEFTDTLIRMTGLEEQYRREDTEESLNRIENIQEFRGSVHEFAAMGEDPTLEGYLENVALVTDLDRADGRDGYATLMTLHSAKGLEFGYVFIPGMEEGIFPSARSLDEEKRLEEERRLMYVGITRAKKRLYLSRASERMMYNQYSHNPPSRFLDEIPPRLVREEFQGGKYSMYSNGHSPVRSSFRTEYSGSEFGFADPDIDSRETVRTLGKPKLKLIRQGTGLNSIPGVTKGFVSSTAETMKGSAIEKLFSPGDRVKHAKFGIGEVTAISGSGVNARMHVRFDTAGEKDLAVAIAPIVKVEEEE